MPLQAPPCKRLPQDRGSLEERGGEEGLDGAVDRARGDNLSRRRRLLRQLSATSILFIQVRRSRNSQKFGLEFGSIAPRALFYVQWLITDTALESWPRGYARSSARSGKTR